MKTKIKFNTAGISKHKLQLFAFQIFGWSLATNLFIVLKVWGIDDQNGYLVLTQPDSFFMVHLQATISGILIGLVLAFIDAKRSRTISHMGFAKIVLIKTGCYMMTVIGIVLLMSFLFILLLGAPLEEAVGRILNFQKSIYFLTIVIYCMIISFLISLIKQIDTMLGPGTMIQIISGRYHKPTIEERIFLFLDLKDSTRHAETLGHIKYSKLIQDFFSDLSGLIEKHRAEIYQYVGDEVILTWKIDNGIKNGNCLKMFFEFKSLLRSRSLYYMNKYGIIPDFKGGMHYGQVTVAEVGEIKKEIAFHGDVINTASRIQNQCNLFNKCLLVSGQLKRRLENVMGFNRELLDTVLLKGKQNPVDLYSFEMAS